LTEASQHNNISLENDTEIPETSCLSTIAQKWTMPNTMFAKLFNHCDKDLGSGSQPVCCEAVYVTVYIKSNMKIKNLRHVHTHTVQTEDGGFDEVFAILSGTIKYLEKHCSFFGFKNGYLHHKIIFMLYNICSCTPN
jgi:hypothetical protein